MSTLAIAFSIAAVERQPKDLMRGEWRTHLVVSVRSAVTHCSQCDWWGAWHPTIMVND
jgi:hypothetical protein